MLPLRGLMKMKIQIYKDATPTALRWETAGSRSSEFRLFTPGALGEFAGFLRAPQQAVETDVAVKLGPIQMAPHHVAPIPMSLQDN